MAIVKFPNPSTATEDGLLAVGGDLDTESLRLSYSKGIYPWPISDEYPIAWFSPDPRGIFFTKDLHISKSLQKRMKKKDFQVTYNTVFAEVIKLCADIKIRKGHDGTWITPDMIAAYAKLFQEGNAYSVEVWQDGKLTGGLYGVTINSFVAGESMFHIETDASKIALVSLIERLRDKGIKWIDTQMVTSVIESLGGTEISRTDYLELLSQVVEKPLSSPLFPVK